MEITGLTIGVAILLFILRKAIMKSANSSAELLDQRIQESSVASKLDFLDDYAERDIVTELASYDEIFSKKKPAPAKEA